MRHSKVEIVENINVGDRKILKYISIIGAILVILLFYFNQRNILIDKVNSIPEIFLVTWYKAILYSLSMKAWAILGIVSFILFLLVLCILFFLNW